MRVLVTGGAGYIGSHTMIELLEANHTPLVVDDFSNSFPLALERVASLSNRKFENVEASVTNASAMLQVMERFKPEAVIHFAGLKSVDESETIPLSYYETNIFGTIQILKAMDAVGCKKIIFSSSATVYGEMQYLPFDEAHPLAPINPYGRTKYFTEEILRDWAANSLNKSVMLLRYFNPVGAHHSGLIGEDPQDAPNNLMTYIAQVAVGRRKKLMIFGDGYDTPDGTGVRDYIHVRDLAKGHVASLNYISHQTGVETVNLGTGKGYSVMEVLSAFSKASGKEIPYDITCRRSGDIATSFADTRKANSILDWEAKLSLDDICESVWRWQQQNPTGYAKTDGVT